MKANMNSMMMHGGGNSGQVMHGYVKFFIAEKGYGFITAQDGTDYFVHFKSIQMDGHKSLATGEQVEFSVGPDPNTGKLAAQNVTGPGGVPPQGQRVPQGGKGKGYGGGKGQMGMDMGMSNYSNRPGSDRIMGGGPGGYGQPGPYGNSAHPLASSGKMSYNYNNPMSYNQNYY